MAIFRKVKTDTFGNDVELADRRGVRAPSRLGVISGDVSVVIVVRGDVCFMSLSRYTRPYTRPYTRIKTATTNNNYYRPRRKSPAVIVYRRQSTAAASARSRADYCVPAIPPPHHIHTHTHARIIKTVETKQRSFRVRMNYTREIIIVITIQSGRTKETGEIKKKKNALTHHTYEQTWQPQTLCGGGGVVHTSTL